MSILRNKQFTLHFASFHQLQVSLCFNLNVSFFFFFFFFSPALIESPSAPQNLSVTFVDQSTVILTWSLPKYLGGRNDTYYRVECESCPSSVTYAPSQEGFNETKVAISGLNPLTTYHFSVYAENGVSGHELSQYVEISVTTTQSSGKYASISNRMFGFLAKQKKTLSSSIYEGCGSTSTLFTFPPY